METENQTTPSVPLSFGEGRGEVLQRSEPWLVESAISLIDSFLEDCRDTVYVLETGMGASTHWLKVRADFLISIEHDPEWYEKIKKTIPPCREHDIYLADTPYNRVIDELEDELFNLILIDGRNRVKCIRSAIPKLKPGGWLVLDNSERPYYQPGIDLMKDWNRIDCRQNRPDKYGFTYPDWTTSIFIKPTA